MKTCFMCKQQKDKSQFTFRNKNSDKLDSYCKACKKKEGARNYRNDVVKKLRQNREAYLRRKYGIGIAEYEEMSAAQNNCCAICKKPREHFKNNFAVDHNHKTGKNRGLLCYRCNRIYVSIHTQKTALAVYQYLMEYDDEDTLPSAS